MEKFLQKDITLAERVRLNLTFDAERMQCELEQLRLQEFAYYNVIQLRAPAHLVDPSIPFPPPAEDYADGSWTDWLNTPQLESSPYLKSIVSFFAEHTDVTLVRLLRLAPQAEVKEHTDPTLALDVKKSVIRLTIPIINPPTVAFYLNDHVVPFKEGECWYLKLNEKHRIINSGDTERINMSIDMIPNEWVRELIADGTSYPPGTHLIT